MSLIKSVGAGEQSTGFYKLLLDQSLKFNDGDNQFLTRTPSTSNQRTWTWSGWIKRGNLGSSQGIFGTDTSSTANFFLVQWTSGDTIFIQGYTSSSETTRLGTTRLFRDPSAWYHIVIAVDTTQATASNRLKLYINGVQETDFSSGNATYPNSQNLDTVINHSSYPLLLGAYDVSGTPDTLDGYLAEINFIDGTALTAASFGETVQGIWTPKDTSGLTFGTNGFHLTFKDDVVSEGFNTVTYTGTGSTQQSISGIGFSPALVWVKSRNATRSHMLTDSVRGRAKSFAVETTGTEYSSAAGRDLASFDGDGFTVGNPENFGSANQSGDDIVAWCWEGGGTPTADNSAGAGATPTAGSVKIDGSNLGSALAGSIPATRLSANTTNGFSVVTYTGTGSAATVAHGLGATPKWIMIKNRGVATFFTVYHTSLGATKYLRLTNNSAQIDNSNVFNDTEPTSSVFTVATVNDVNASGNTYVAYCWTDISGYSKFGTWQNNNSTTGTQVTGLGFKPAWLMVKDIDAGETWYILDNTRQPTNVSPPSTKFLIPNANSAEGSNNASTATIDFQDDGFQIKTTNPASGEISYGTRNYVYMAFADTREAAFFKDVTTNGNHFTPVNLDYRDSVPDTPTNNFATFNPLLFNANVYSEGNLKNASAGNDWEIQVATMFPAGISGKWYAEFYVHTCDASGTRVGVGVTDANVNPENYLGQASPDVAYYDINDIYTGGSKTADSNLTFAAGDIISVALNLDDGEVTFRKNNSTMTNGTQDLIASTLYTFATTNYGSGAGVIVNFGQDSSFSGNHATANGNADGNGHGSFAYAPPSGFLSLCSQNLPDAAIIDGSENFNTVLYTGNAGTQSITGVGFSPDWLWVKNRGTTYNHALVDSVRGATLSLASNSTAAERTSDITSLDSDGFSLQFVTATGSFSENQGSQSYVAWNWLAGTAFSNDASATGVGSIDSEGQVNTKAGFSIVKFTCGSGVTSGTVAHGLGVQPQLLIGATRNHDVHWYVQTPLLATNLAGILSATDAFYNPGYNHWNDTHPTTSVFSVGGYMAGHSDLTNPSTKIVYCFANVEGYSKVGTFLGNGNADGPFVYTGFRPAWVMVKQSSAAGGWNILDDKRQTFNDATGLPRLYANTNAAEEDANTMEGQAEFLSNGFKLRSNHSSGNTSGKTIIYLAFASQPLKFSNAF